MEHFKFLDGAFSGIFSDFLGHFLLRPLGNPVGRLSVCSLASVAVYFASAASSYVSPRAPSNLRTGKISRLSMAGQQGNERAGNERAGNERARGVANRIADAHRQNAGAAAVAATRARALEEGGFTQRATASPQGTEVEWKRAFEEMLRYDSVGFIIIFAESTWVCFSTISRKKDKTAKWRTCWRCRGDTLIPCEYCGAKGTTTCVHGHVSCPATCRYLPCIRCGGTKLFPCSTCKSKGRVNTT